MKKLFFMQILFLLVLSSLSALARGPAVEPFFGVEPKTYNPDRHPSSTPTAYDFNQKIEAEEKFSTFSFAHLVGLLAVISLPFLLWNMLALMLDKKKHLEKSNDNVVSFPKNNNHDDDNHHKKAS